MSANEQLAEKLYKPVIKKFKRRKVYPIFKDNISGADLTEMGSLSFNDKNIKFLCVIGVFTKYEWVKSLTDKKAKTVLNAFMEIVNESNCKQSKLWLIKEENFTINVCKNG